MTNNSAIKATSNILNLLGKELIGTDSLALFELVKNAYDADATVVKIKFVDLNTPNQKIIIEDDGTGMSLDVLQNVWLTIGTDYKRRVAKRSKVYKRTSLGNKGVGRLAVHKLAEAIRLETKSEESDNGFYLEINWENLINSADLIQDLRVSIEELPSNCFTIRHGTRIILSRLKTKVWSKTLLRATVRKIYSIQNPLTPIPNFKILVKSNDSEQQEWIDDLEEPIDILNNSPISFEFTLSPSDTIFTQSVAPFAHFDWKYEFDPHTLKGLKARCSSSSDDRELYKHGDLKINRREILPMSRTKPSGNQQERGDFYLMSENLSSFGVISGKFHFYNNRGPLLDLVFGTGKRTAVKDYIKQNRGIKIFRDNIRVYNYGEPSDDWLGLDVAKRSRSGNHMDRNNVIGAVSISMDASKSNLVEKTNREGFIENELYIQFQDIIRQVFVFFEQLAQNDRLELDAVQDKSVVNKKVGLSTTIKSLVAKLEEKGIYDEFQTHILRLENDYNSMRNVMVQSGMTGLNIGIVFHEVEREVRLIDQEISTNDYIDQKSLRLKFDSLKAILNSFSPLLKQKRKKHFRLNSVLKQSVILNQNRFKRHGIKFSCPILDNQSEDFEVYGSVNLLLSCFSNMIDNAIYWTSAKKPIADDDYLPEIIIDSDLHSFDGPALIIADNGLGLTLDPEQALEAFRTEKPDGMGLGLYYVNLVLESMGAKIVFMDSSDLVIPPKYTGACIVLIFPSSN